MINQNQFNTLAAASPERAVSIYIPTYRVGRPEEDQLRLKNALKEAEGKLGERYGLREPEAEKFLGRAYDLLNNRDFWNHQSDGLALFVDDTGRFETYPCPVDFDPLVYVAEEFYLRPLVTLVGEQQRFHILALAKGNVSLYSATQYSIVPVDLNGLVPENMEAALMLDVTKADNDLTRAGGPEGGRGGSIPIYFSRGGDPGTDVEDLKTYLDRVDKGIADYLCDDNAPLVVGGTEKLVATYRKANTYAHLYESGAVSGNLENASPGMIHEKAWAVIAPHFDEQRTRDRELYGANVVRGEAGNDLQTIVPAAVNGRIAALWIERGRYAYGRYTPENNGIELAEEGADGATELFNLAAIKALQTKARIYQVGGGNTDDDSETRDLPAPGTGLCAIYRYAVDTDTTNL